jgi:hypothetical protein
MRRDRKAQLELFFGVPITGVPTPLSRATARRSKHIEAPAPKPWHCVILAVDTARRSGYARYYNGHLEEHGETDTLDEPILERIVENTLERAGRTLPCVLVLEAPFGGSVDVVTALGVARERWLRAWRKADQSPARVVKVQPSTWRAPVLGSEWVGRPRAEVRAHEMRVATAFVQRGYPSGFRPMPLGGDQAAAILIGRWAAHAARVGRAIGKRAAKASLRAWTGTASHGRQRRKDPSRS